MSNLERKLDTRYKIEMGGLVKKAGLDDLHATSPEALLGILLEAKKIIDADSTVINKYKKIGKDNW